MNDYLYTARRLIKESPELFSWDGGYEVMIDALLREGASNLTAIEIADKMLGAMNG